MIGHADAYTSIERSVTAWVQSRPDVHAVMVVGSGARTDRPADEFSDLDLVLFADEPNRLIDSDDWLAELGAVVMSFVEETAVGGWRERRAVFEPMLDVDFAVVPASLLTLDFSAPGPVTDVVRPVVNRGFRILYDDTERLATFRSLPVSPTIAWAMPDQPAFSNMVVDFWYHAMWTTKKLLRGEIVVARKSLDGNMKEKLLLVINWLAHLGKPDIDTWHGGRFFETWSDQEIVKMFHATYGHATEAGIRSDLSRAMDLFSMVAHDAAQRLEYNYPEQAEARVREWIRHARPEAAAQV
jgi:aminoglycoside 6-adenylyltransferase